MNEFCEVRLKRDNSLVATYEYDPLGRRIVSVRPTPSVA